MSVRYAFATLLTSDAYLPGALTIAAALKDVHRTLLADQTVEYETVCLVTPQTVDIASIRLLRKAFNVVIGVEVIIPPDSDSLALLGRPDLDTTLTKLHVFRLTQYSKVIFLDADVLPLRPLSHLFHLEHDFSASPDVGWPDIFNSGVMVLSPGEGKFKQLQELLNTKGSWDGADQGLLNEWRGNDWNRLSFTYNTTPTAIYTYAPAYQRFGSQISIIHFIGPHKPWHSIAYRAPGSSAQADDMVRDPTTEIAATHPPTYDYGSLVDRWYSVYDRHYRSQSAEPRFQPTKYTSVWNEEGLHSSISSRRTLGLEELRRVALEGMGALGISPLAHGEGEYRAMPLEGRFDLIRPRTRAERMQAQASEDRTETPESTLEPTELPSTPEPSTPPGQILPLQPGSPVRWATLPTPGTNEIPPAPHTRVISLPPTPLRYVSAPYKPLRITRDAEAQTSPNPPEQRELGGADLSPMPLVSNFAVDTPNTVIPVPTDTYFPKVWDVDRSWSSVSPSSSETSLTTMEPSSPKTQPTSNTLFGLSVPSTPEIQGRYRNVFREEKRSPGPDISQVKRIFPWEEHPRHTPARVFPGEGSPSPALRRIPVFATPERKVTFHSPMPSPLTGFPPSFQPHYLSDSQFPGRRVGKTGWSVPSSSRLSLEDVVETDSQDGDIEDEIDSGDEAMMRSRISGIDEMTKRTPGYRSVGVQTEPRDLREEGVQATTFVPESQAAEKGDLSTHDEATSSAAMVHPILSPPILGSPPLLTDDGMTSLPLDSADGIHLLSASLSPAISPMVPTRGPLPSHAGRGSRVWDPARGVETFKRGSEEVLAKFMGIGSWEERA